MSLAMWTRLAEPWRCVVSGCPARLDQGCTVWFEDDGSVFCPDHGKERERIITIKDESDSDPPISAVVMDVRSCAICDGPIEATAHPRKKTCSDKCKRVLRRRNKPSAD